MALAPGGDPSLVNVISFDLGQQRPVARAVDDDCKPGAPFVYVDNSAFHEPNERYECRVAPGPYC